MRQFKCKGLKEKAVTLWSQAFKIGRLYNEAPAYLAKVECNDDVLLLYSEEDKNPLYVWFVDKDQFEECTN